MSTPIRGKTARRSAPSQPSSSRIGYLYENARRNSRASRSLRASQIPEAGQPAIPEGFYEDQDQDQLAWIQERIQITSSATSLAVSRYTHQDESQSAGWEVEEHEEQYITGTGQNIQARYASPGLLPSLGLVGQGNLADRLSFNEYETPLVDEEMEGHSDAETMHTVSMRDAFGGISDAETIRGLMTASIRAMSLDPRENDSHSESGDSEYTSQSRWQSRSATPKKNDVHPGPRLQQDESCDPETSSTAIAEGLSENSLVAGRSKMNDEESDGDDAEDEEEEVTQRPRTTRHRRTNVVRRRVSMISRSPSPAPLQRPPRRTPRKRTRSS